MVLYIILVDFLIEEGRKMNGYLFVFIVVLAIMLGVFEYFSRLRRKRKEWKEFLRERGFRVTRGG